MACTVFVEFPIYILTMKDLIVAIQIDIQDMMMHNLMNAV